MAWADPTTGTVQEMTALGSVFFDAWGLGPQTWSLSHGSDFALYLAMGLVGGQLTWNATSSDYELAFSRSITAGTFTGSFTVNISITFFMSSDGSGAGVQVSPMTGGGAALSTVHSISYTRHMQADFTNSVSNTERKTSSTSNFLLTNLTIGGSTPGFTLSGTKSGTFTHLHADGTTVVGTFSQTISPSSPIVVTATLQPGGTYMVSATGQIVVTYDATITKADGTVTTVSRTATVTLNNQGTVHVDMDGTEVDADSTTGEISGSGGVD